jgi:adenylate cyclase
MIRRLRLVSGLVMLAYVAMHLLNHAAGLISLEAMENVLGYMFRIWGNRPMQLLLYGSFLTHYALALYALWQRRTLRLRASELTQMALGFAIPLLLVRHVVMTRISENFFHTGAGSYSFLLWVYFVRSPDHGFVQFLALVVAWGHAMIGLHFWLRVRGWYARLQPAALIIAGISSPGRQRGDARHKEFEFTPRRMPFIVGRQFTRVQEQLIFVWHTWGMPLLNG